MKLINFFLVKKLRIQKGKIFSKIFLEIVLFMVLKRNWNRNLAKVVNGTVTFQK
jgi:hypothetical protein